MPVAAQARTHLREGTSDPGGGATAASMIPVKAGVRGVHVRVLVVGTSGTGVARATDALAAAGHEVVTCHRSGDPPFPCGGLVDGHGCPLDRGPIDVVLDAHVRPSRAPSGYETGVVCGLRRGVPLVVAGASVHPYWRWAAVEVGHDDDVVAACEKAAEASVEQHADANVARAAARAALTGAGTDPVGTAATVHRRGDELHVLLELPPRPPGLHHEVVESVVSELRALHPTIATIDVAIA